MIWPACQKSYLEFRTNVGVVTNGLTAAPNMQRQPSERFPFGVPYFSAMYVTQAWFTLEPVGSWGLGFYRTV